VEALQPAHLKSVEVAGAGFVNFYLFDSWLHEELQQILVQGEEGYARTDLSKGERVQIEFVSANPTGPLHVGNGWWGAYGDSLARIMERCGFDVTREYYVNDTGGQIRRLGESLLKRKAGQQVGEDGYQGSYVAELAAQYRGPDDTMEAGRWAAGRILENIRSTLSRLNIVFDEWFSQASIEESGAVQETIDLLDKRGLVYEEDGAIWLRSAALGDSRDRVLIKSNGDPTYLAGDIAYHRNKFLIRGFDRVIDVFGADHHGQVPSLLAGVQALGVDPGRLEIRLGQMVSLAEGKMSKRQGNFVSLDSLIDDLGPDAVRLLSLMSSIDQATTLDLDLVRKQSMENPVYYIQYAHARISSIQRFAQAMGVERVSLDKVDLSLLTEEAELRLIRVLIKLPEVVIEACSDREPHKVTTWVRELAGTFHSFYHDLRVVGGDVPAEITQARLWLVEGVRIGLFIGLHLLGVSAPSSM
jgi:arginyl-tRNA synthetase